MSRRRVYDCLWCPETFAKIADQLDHLHTAHADTIGRGPTASRTWSCWACATSNAPTSSVCSNCGWNHPNITEPQEATT